MTTTTITALPDPPCRRSSTASNSAPRNPRRAAPAVRDADSAGARIYRRFRPPERLRKQCGFNAASGPSTPRKRRNWPNHCRKAVPGSRDNRPA